MMHEDGKSDSAIAAEKPANEAQGLASELVERRAGAKGNAFRQSTRRTQSRASVTQALERIRQMPEQFAARRPRHEPYALIGHVRICGGRPVMGFTTAMGPYDMINLPNLGHTTQQPNNFVGT